MIDISGHLRSYKQECGFEDTSNYITVNCCGYQKFITKNFTRHREKGRLDFQIIYIFKGKGLFKIGNQLEEVNAGSMILYRPCDVQSYTYYFENTPEVYWIHFTGFGASDLLSKTGFSDHSIYEIGLSNNLIEIYKKIMKELQIKRPMYEQAVNGLLLELISYMGRRFFLPYTASEKAKDANLWGVIENMHNSYNLKWSVKDFAKQCNLSTYRFIHNFKAYTGMSPIEYLTHVRIDKAKELLLDSTLNISEISDVVGYENSLYFSRIFKKLSAVSPTDYRKTSNY